MRVLIASDELQGTEPGDFAGTVEGELVTPVVADVECATPDVCGCGRGFPGLASAKATTTAMVVERASITEDDLRDVIADWLERSGWIELLAEHGDDPDAGIDDIVDEHVDAIDRICHSFELGAVVERNGSTIHRRSHRRAA